MAETPRADTTPPGSHPLPSADPALGPSTVPAGSPGSGGQVREAVAVFTGIDAMQAAIDELTMNGFGQHELSLMASDDTVRDQLGRVHGHVDDAKHDPDTPRRAIVSPEEVGNAKGIAMGVPAYVGAILATGAVVASGGTALAAAAAAVAAGAGGGGLGAILAGWIGNQREETLRQHLDKGGILLWVNLRDGEREQLAREILGRHAAQPVEVHEIPQDTGRPSA